jgi:hypothetical protein
VWPILMAPMGQIVRSRPKEFLDDEVVVLRALIGRGAVPWDTLVEMTRLGDDRVSEAVDVLVARRIVMFIRSPQPNPVAMLLTPAGADQLARAQTVGRQGRARSFM